MAEDLNKKEVEELRRLIDLLEKDIKGIEFDNLLKSAGAARALLKSLRKESQEFTSDVSYAAEGFRKVVGEIRKTDQGFSQAAKSFSKLASISDRVQYHQKEISKLSLKEVENLKKQAGQEKTKLETANNLISEKINRTQSYLNNIQGELDLLDRKLETNGDLSDAEYARYDALERRQKIFNKELTKQKGVQNEINATLEGHNALFNGLVSALDNINNELEEEKKKLGLTGALLDGLNKIPFLKDIIDTNSALDAAKDKIKEGGSKTEAMKAAFSNVGKQIKTSLTDPLVVTGFLINQIVDALKIVDSSAGDLAKSFDLSYTGANQLRMELTDIANLSGDVAVNTRGLQESMVAVGQSLGVNAALNKEDLITFTKLREQAGYTNDELVGIQKLTLATGGSLEDNAKSFLGTVESLNAQNKLSINAKQLLKEVANVSDAIKLSVGGTVKSLAEAAFKAKQFGITLEQADKISESLLDFESSINNQISAELITGKALNLDKARLLALNGNIAEASAEILKQVGGTAEFTKMNRIQQEALAKAAGMTREELAKSLVDREAAQKLGAKEGQSAQDRYNELVKQYGVEKAQSMLGDEALARQFQQQSIQERFTQAVEKLKEVFISLTEPLLPVLDVFAQIFKIIGPIAGFIGTIVKYTIDWGKYLLLAVGAYKLLKFLGDGVYRTKILSNTAARVGLITDQQAIGAQRAASVVAKGTLLTEGQKEIVKKRSLGTVIATNIQEKLGLSTKEGGLLLAIKESAIKAKDFLLDKASLAFQYTKNILGTVFNAIKQNSLLLTIRESAIKAKDFLLEKASLVFQYTKNALETTYNAIKQSGLLLAIKGSAIKAKDFLLDKASLIFQYTRNALEIGYNAIKRIGSAISKSELLINIGSAAMKAIQSLASIPIVGWALGLAAAGAVTALGYKFMKGDDVISPGKNSGYGERTLLTSKGAIAFNNQDTIVAGTNLGLNKKSPELPKYDDVKIDTTGNAEGMSKGTYQLDTESSKIDKKEPKPLSTPTSSPSIDLSPIITAINNLSAKIESRPVIAQVELDGEKLTKGVMKRTTVGGVEQQKNVVKVQ